MYNSLKIRSLRPIKNHVIVEAMNFGERVTSGGLILRADDAKLEGVRPRWAKVYAVGPENTDVRVGDWILVSHGRWTRGIKIHDGVERVVRRVDVGDILAVTNEEPSDDNVVLGL
jgi:co-chaperonin GroES (HSP10)